MAEYNADHGDEDAERAARENQSDTTTSESPRANLFQDYMHHKVNLDLPRVNFEPPQLNFDAAKAMDLYGSYPTNMLGIPDFRAIVTPAGVYSPSIPTTDGSTPTQKPDTGFMQGLFLPLDMYQRAKELRQWGHFALPDEENSKERHRTVSYMFTHEYGSFWADVFGMGNEIQGLLMHDIPDLPGRIRGDRPWAFSLNDLWDNREGSNQAVGHMLTSDWRIQQYEAERQQELERQQEIERQNNP